MVLIVCGISRIRPVSYELVSLHDAPNSNLEAFLRTADYLPKDFLALFVKRLCLSINVDVSSAARVLQACSGVLSLRLACWVDLINLTSPTSLPTIFTPLIAILPLKHLSIRIDHFNDLMRDAPSYKQPRWCARLTHLALLFWVGQDECTPQGLSTLASLTHLSLHALDNGSAGHSDEYVSDILNSCMHLKMLMVIRLPLYLEPQPRTTRLTDPRVVWMPYPEDIDVVSNWEAPSRGLPDIWSRGEDIVRKQMKMAQVVSRNLSASQCHTEADYLAGVLNIPVKQLLKPP